MTNWPLKTALFLSFLVLAILLNSVGAVALHVQRAYGVPSSSAATLALYKSVGIISASFVAGLFLTRIGYRRAMLLSLGTLAGVCLLVPLVPDFAMLKLLFVIAGIAFALIKVSVYATIGLITADQKAHASTMSVLESFFPVGIIAGNFLFGAFTDDTEAAAPGWLRVFYVLAALCAALALFLTIVRFDESRIHPSDRKRWREEMSAAWRASASPLVLLFGACVFLYVMIEQSTMNWLPTFNSTVLQLPPRLSIQLASSLTVAVILGRLAAGAVLRRWPWQPVLFVCLITSAALLFAGLSSLAEINLPLQPIMRLADAPLATAMFPAIGFFLAPIYPALNSAMLSRVPVVQQGGISSWGVMVSACGSSTGTLIVGYLFDMYGGRQAFYSALVPMAGLLVALFFFSRKLPTRMMAAS